MFLVTLNGRMYKDSMLDGDKGELAFSIFTKPLNF